MIYSTQELCDKLHDTSLYAHGFSYQYSIVKISCQLL